MAIGTPHLLLGGDLARGENARVEIHKDLNGGCQMVVKDARHPEGYRVGLSPNSTVGLAFALLEAIGIPIQAELARKAKERSQ